MVALPSLRTWSPGEMANAAMLNANVRDPVNFYRQPPMFYGRLLTTVSIANNAWTSVGSWFTEVDTENGYPGGGTDITVRQTGTYDIRAIAFFAPNAAGTRACKIERIAAGSGTSYTMIEAGQVSSANDPDGLSGPGTATVDTTVRIGDPGYQLFAGDRVRMWVAQTSGGGLNLMGAANDTFTYFCMQWVAA